MDIGCGKRVFGSLEVLSLLLDGLLGGEKRTDFGGALHLHYVDALGHGGAGVVDDIEHGLAERRPVSRVFLFPRI